VSTLSRWLSDLATTHGEAGALVDPDGDDISFVALEARVAALAGGLRSVGLRRGDRIAAFLPNGGLPVELLLAAARIGAVTVGVNTRYRIDDLRHVLTRARPRLLVSADSFLGIDFHDVVGPALEGLAHRPVVLWPDQVEELRAAAAMLEDDADPTDLLVAFTTSGTTGAPKLAAHTHETTVAHLQAAARSLQVRPGSTGLMTLPVCGTFGFVALLAVLAGGGKMVVPPRFEPASAARLVERYAVTHLNGSDDMLLAVVEQGRTVSSWSQGVQAEFTGRGLEAVRAAETVGARVTGVYGSSETFAFLARWHPDDEVAVRGRNGGILVDEAMEVRAVDATTGRPVPAGQVGELQLRGPSVLGAYLEPEADVAPPLTADGWWPTGDLGTVESPRSFVYLARLGDALRLAGFLTDPAEIEQHLLRHDAVTGASVVGAHARSGGDVAIAFVTSARPTNEEELLEHCRRGLANYKRPARVIIVDRFPVVDGANGVKIRKADLRAQAAALSL
jgi:acyl-CoA synthetase (AMP-forming)/AMP-acid ligase II